MSSFVRIGSYLGTLTIGVFLLCLQFFVVHGQQQEELSDFQETRDTTIDQITDAFSRSAIFGDTYVDRERSISVAIPEDLVIRSDQGIYDPTKLNPHLVSEEEVVGPFILDDRITVHIGSYEHDLFFEKEDGSSYLLPIRIPVQESFSGSLVVYSSSDGIDWDYHGEAEFVSGSDGMYVEFYTDHLTFFSVGPVTGDFVIENDTPVVYSRDVELNISSTPSGGVALQSMKFADTFAGLSAVSYVPYQPTYPYVLPVGNGTKRVYAELLNTNGKRVVTEDSVKLQQLVEVGRIEDVRNGWVSYVFQKTYARPPVVIATPSTDNNGNNPPIPRIRNVTTQGFEISVCVDAGMPECDVTALPEDIDVVIFDRDVADSVSWIDVGVATAPVDGSTTSVTLSSPISTGSPFIPVSPLIRLSPQTSRQDNEIAAHGRVSNTFGSASSVTAISIVGCIHSGIGDVCSGGPAEEFGYAVIDETAPLFWDYGSVSITNSTRTDVVFSTVSDPVMMVSQNSDNGVEDPQYTQARNITSTDAQVRYCEADTGGECDLHVAETIHWAAFQNKPAWYINPIYSTYDLTTGSVGVELTFSQTGFVVLNNDGSEAYTFTSNGDFVFEVKPPGGGLIEVIVSVSWIYDQSSGMPIITAHEAANVSSTGRSQFAFSDTYQYTPLVLTTPVTTTDGDNYPIPTIRNVTTTGFEMRVCVDDGQVACSSTAGLHDIHYFVVNVAETKFTPGIDAGRVFAYTDGSITSFSVDIPSTKSSIRTTSQTASQNGNMSAVSWIDSVTFVGPSQPVSVDMIGCVHQSVIDDCTVGQPEELYGYLAIDISVFSFPGMQMGTTLVVDSQRTPISFSPAFQAPRVMVSSEIFSNDIGDPLYPWARNIVASGADVRYCEADGANTCDFHTAERVNWFALDDYNTADVSVFAPSSCSLSGAQVQSNAFQFTDSCSGYFGVEDVLGLDQGYYTTLQISDLVGTYSTISASDLAIQAGPLTVLGGSANPGVILNSSLSSFISVNTPVTYISRASGPNGGIVGEYGTTLDFRVSFPSYVRPDVFTGSLTLTLY